MWVTRELGHHGARTQVYDPASGLLRVIYTAPHGPAIRRLTSSLRRLGRRGGATPALLDVEKSPGGWRVLTEWAEGETLAAYLKAARSGERAWPSPYETVRLFRRFVHGLCQFHQFTGQVHGDVSPANLVVQAQPLGLVLIDYGSAWPMSDVRAANDGEGATLGYAAPERFDAPTFASDQFAATAVFYEMLTGKLPYDGLGGQAGRADYRDAFEGKYAPPSLAAREPQHLPTSCWRLVDRLAGTGLRLNAGERFDSGSRWRRAADDAWRAADTAAQRGPWERAGAAVASLIERLAHRSNK